MLINGMEFDKAWVDVSFDFHKLFCVYNLPTPNFESWFCRALRFLLVETYNFCQDIINIDFTYYVIHVQVEPWGWRLKVSIPPIRMLTHQKSNDPQNPWAQPWVTHKLKLVLPLLSCNLPLKPTRSNHRQIPTRSATHRHQNATSRGGPERLREWKEKTESWKIK